MRFDITAKSQIRTSAGRWRRDDAYPDAFRTGLKSLGYTEGSNIEIELRYADGLFSRAIESAKELVKLNVSIIVAHHTPTVKAAMTATTTIPIVMAPAGAPLETGLVASLARPGGNVTGLSSMEAELGSKRINLLRDAIPGLTKVAVLASRSDPFTGPYLADAQTAALRAGLVLHPAMVDDRNFPRIRMIKEAFVKRYHYCSHRQFTTSRT